MVGEVKRVRVFNRWDDEGTLSEVFFYLENSARIWFENHESSLTSWALFKTEFINTFTTVVRKERAEHATPNECVVVLVEDMKRLFNRADPNMSEEKKLRLLIQGAKQELFAWLVRNHLKTVAEFMSEAAAMEKSLDVRPKQYERQASSIMLDHVDAIGVSADALRETIRAVVREDLKKLFPTTTQPQVAGLSDVIRE